MRMRISPRAGYIVFKITCAVRLVTEDADFDLAKIPLMWPQSTLRQANKYLLTDYLTSPDI
jgi:hypothetical protein